MGLARGGREMCTQQPARLEAGGHVSEVWSRAPPGGSSSRAGLRGRSMPTYIKSRAPPPSNVHHGTQARAPAAAPRRTPAQRTRGRRPRCTSTHLCRPARCTCSLHRARSTRMPPPRHAPGEHNHKLWGTRFKRTSSPPISERSECECARQNTKKSRNPRARHHFQFQIHIPRRRRDRVCMGRCARWPML